MSKHSFYIHEHSYVTICPNRKWGHRCSSYPLSYPCFRPLGASTTHMRFSRPLMRPKHCKLSARAVTSLECGSRPGEAQSTPWLGRFAASGEPPQARRVFRDQNYAWTGRSRHPCQLATGRHQGRCTYYKLLKLPANSRGITFCQEYHDVQRMVSRKDIRISATWMIGAGITYSLTYTMYVHYILYVPINKECYIFSQNVCAKNGVKNKTSEYVQRVGLAIRIQWHKICKIKHKNM